MKEQLKHFFPGNELSWQLKRDDHLTTEKTSHRKNLHQSNRKREKKKREKKR